MEVFSEVDKLGASGHVSGAVKDSSCNMQKTCPYFIVGRIEMSSTARLVIIMKLDAHSPGDSMYASRMFPNPIDRTAPTTRSISFPGSPKMSRVMMLGEEQAMLKGY